MKTQIVLLALTILITLSSAQVIAPPKYDFEKVEWGDHLSKVKKLFSKKNISEVKISDNPFAKKLDGIFQYGYTDSINSEKIGILYQFRSEDSTLQTLLVAYINLDPNKKDEKENETTRMGILGVLTNHYPSEYQERSIPFMGTVRIWTLTKTSVQAYLLQSSVTIILTKR